MGSDSSRLNDGYCGYLLKYGISLCKYPFMSTSAIFADIHRNRIWNRLGSVSGDGSVSETVSVLLEHLPLLVKSYGIRSMLDIPCGDFTWISRLSGCGDIDYTGADIVPAIIEENREKSVVATGGFADIRFLQLDICSDLLPEADLIFCRDCLVHLSNRRIFRALDNIKRSAAEYLLMTTFPERSKNFNMLTGAWRPLNFEKPPFSLSPPLELINERYVLRGGRFADKSMALWRISDL